MKKLILIGSLFLSHAAFAGNGAKGAELFVRLMVRGSAELARDSGGNLANALCGKIPRHIAVDSMLQKIAGGPLAKASGADRAYFKKSFEMYLVKHAVDDNLSASTHVTMARAVPAGHGFSVGTQVSTGYSSVYQINGSTGVSDADLAALEVKLINNGALGALQGAANSIESSYTVVAISSKGDVATRLRDSYAKYAQGRNQPGVLQKDYFQNIESVSGTCP